MAYKPLLLICVVTALFLMGLASAAGGAPVRATPVEKRILKAMATKRFKAMQDDRRCHQKSRYTVYLIDNFVQPIRIVPELTTSHGEMLLRLLRSGRDDIAVKVLNTSLSKGLVMVKKSLPALAN
jgi:hypothetical protein